MCISAYHKSRHKLLVIFSIQSLTLDYVLMACNAAGGPLLINRLERRLIYMPPPPITPFQGRLKNVQRDENQTSNLTAEPETKPVSISAWTPEQYPDPWTNPLACGGAATAPYRSSNKNQEDLNSTNVSYPILDDDFIHWFNPAVSRNDEQTTDESQFSQQNKLIFCDPDQLLDMDTLKSVAFKLQIFARTFASDTEDGIFDSNEETNTITPETKVTGSWLASLTNVIKAVKYGDPKKTNHGDANRRQLRSQDNFFKRQVRKESSIKESIEIGIALVKKIDLPAILRADSYFFYSDQDDMMNDAAQYFARYIHDTWYKHLLIQEQRRSSPSNIVLIFISTSDKICYISSGTRIAAILPWWRLEHVVQNMKPDLRRAETGNALSIAIDELTQLLEKGPPSFLDRLDDFVERFGVVIAFTLFTFIFATLGECRDRRKRFFSAERMSKMNAAEKQKARKLQREFKTNSCPICLEPYEITSKQIDFDKLCTNQPHNETLKRVDSFGIPLIGSDDEPIKMLRCGHIFDNSCWRVWVNSGQGNPWICPVCRQEVGRVKRRRVNSSMSERAVNIQTMSRGQGVRPNEVEERRAPYARVPPVTSSMLLLPVGHTHPSYSSIQPLASLGGTPFAPFSHPPLRRLHPRPGTAVTQIDDPPSEEIPLHAQMDLATEDSDDY